MDLKKYSISELLNKAKIISIFGAGSGGATLLKRLKMLGYNPSIFWDSSRGKWWENINGSICLPKMLLKRSPKKGHIICIASSWAKDIARELKKSKHDNYIDLTYWSDNLKNNFDSKKLNALPTAKINKACSLLEDGLSRKILRASIRYRLSADPLKIMQSKEPQYFHPAVHAEPKDIIFDIGAWTGDSAIEFFSRMHNTGKIYSFEPDPDNYSLLKKTISKGKLKNYILPINKAIARKNTTIFINKDASDIYGNETFVNNRSGSKIRAISIDSFVKNRNIIPTMIKMDIEGAEYEALQGAKNTIKEYSPKLQISIYHRIEDLWRIPVWIKSINPDYRLFIRHHSQSLVDTVLYATI